MRTHFRLLREHPWWTAGVVGLLLLWGGWWLRETVTRARVVAAMETWLAEHPEAVETPVTEGENAAVVYARILDGLDLDTGAVGPIPPPPAPLPAAFRKAMEANAGPLALVEGALDRPRYPPDSEVGEDSRRNLYFLMALLHGRAAIQREGGDLAGSLRTVIQAHRVGRQTRMSFSAAVAGLHPLLDLLEEPGLDRESLRVYLDLGLTPEEWREGFAGEWQGFHLRRTAKQGIEVLGPDGEELARGRGWRTPTLLERVQAGMGRPLPRGVGHYPSAVQMERMWEAQLEMARVAGLRGREAFPVFPPLDPTRAPRAPSEEVEMADALKRSIRWAYRTEAWLAVLRTAAAVRLHEVETGALPARLEDLVPGVVPELPRDPFDDGPLRWTVRPGVGGKPVGTLETVWVPQTDGGRDMGERPRARLR